MSFSPRLLVLGLAAAGIVVGGVAVLRLGAVVSATPASLWLEPYPRLVDTGTPVDEATRSRAEFLAGVLGDASLMRGAIDSCVRAAVRADAGDNAMGRCLGTIDRALDAMPSSGELWLEKARLLLVSGESGGPVFDALRNSYRVSPKEGWIAGGRVVLGLRIYPSLPVDLQERVKDDFRLVMIHPRLSAALVNTYAVDAAFRQSAAAALEGASESDVRAFAELVHDRLELWPSG